MFNCCELWNKWREVILLPHFGFCSMLVIDSIHVSLSATMSQDKLTRIAIVSNDKCKPKKCRQECRKSCPVVRMGKFKATLVLPHLLSFIFLFFERVHHLKTQPSGIFCAINYKQSFKFPQYCQKQNMSHEVWTVKILNLSAVSCKNRSLCHISRPPSGPRKPRKP